MMSDLRAAAQQALEYLEFCWRDVPMNEYSTERLEETINMLDSALAQPATAQAEQVKPFIYQTAEDLNRLNPVFATPQPQPAIPAQPSEQGPIGYVLTKELESLDEHGMITMYQEMQTSCFERRYPQTPVYLTAQPAQRDSKDALLTSLLKVMSWIDNWSPEFVYDPEWTADKDAALAAIAATQEKTI